MRIQAQLVSRKQNKKSCKEPLLQKKAWVWISAPMKQNWGRGRQRRIMGTSSFGKKKNAQGETLPQRIKPESSRRSQTPFSSLCLCVLVHPHTCVHSTFTHEYIRKTSKPQNNKILNQLYKKVNELVTILKGWTVLENECVSVYCCVICSLQR